jgi:hypothetical protein
MKKTTNRGGIRAVWAWLPLVVLLCLSSRTQARDEKFDLLRTKTAVYTNVTVTSKTETDVYIFHSAGICNLKVADLSPEALRQLHYITGPEPGASGAKSSVGASAVSQAASATKELNAQVSAGVQKMRAAGTTVLIITSVVSLLMYLFVCHCLKLICEKAGVEPGILIWVPLLQLLPLLRAAGMSPAWMVAWLVPGVNLIAQIIWSFKITAAREKAAWVAVLLLLPFTNLFALLYLAFSNGASSKDEPVGRVPLVLETN